jgi:hypothetical protein
VLVIQCISILSSFAQKYARLIVAATVRLCELDTLAYVVSFIIYFCQVSEPKKTDEQGRQDEQVKLEERAAEALMDLYEVVMRDFYAEQSARSGFYIYIQYL